MKVKDAGWDLPLVNPPDDGVNALKQGSAGPAEAEDSLPKEGAWGGGQAQS